MIPSFPTDYPADRSLINLEFEGELYLSSSSSVEISDGLHVFIGELGFVIPGALNCEKPVSSGVVDVSRSGYILEVVDRVIGFDPVFVVDHKTVPETRDTSGRLFQESSGYKRVDCSPFSYPVSVESYPGVSPSIGLSVKYSAFNPKGLSVSSRNDTVKRSNSSERANFVSVCIPFEGYGQPDFLWGFQMQLLLAFMAGLQTVYRYASINTRWERVSDA